MDKNKRAKLRDGIAMIITGVIAVLMVFGVNVPVISDTVIGKVAYVIAFAISYAVNHYFNHNYSEEAKQSQELMDYLKEAKKINEYVQHVDNYVNKQPVKEANTNEEVSNAEKTNEDNEDEEESEAKG
uniref:SPP1 phage holin n=1 Tax=Podoviridae sp. ctlSr7 TaxID=2826573 RepID=A0A8S5MY70_9CAUD|nr:MAG TPA: SPP1 phage holin [Podoviridae sp. ctlSr7]